ncbi:MAG: cell envelope integrity protein TolA [Gammaproteobacteria bacterium]|nr:cell envelope integrity protein TolA [Gammaproteobacteria bacterium]
MWKAIRENPRAVVYAVLMHLVLLALLMFSLDWTPKISRTAGESQPIQAELIDQRRLEDIEQRKRQAELETKQKAEIERQRQAELEAKQKAEVERQRQAELEAKQKAELVAKQKAELAAKQKAEREAKQRAELEAKQKAEREAKQKAELEAKQKAELEAKQKAELEAKQKAEAERKRQAELAAKQKAEAEAALQAQIAAEQARLDEQRIQSVLGEFIGYIADKVERNWLRPAGSSKGLRCKVNVKVIPGGDVASARVIESSGDPVFDRSAENAVLRASPLPMPEDAAIARHFRDFNFNFEPY